MCTQVVELELSTLHIGKLISQYDLYLTTNANVQISTLMMHDSFLQTY
jgi:hypothetical protein